MRTLLLLTCILFATNRAASQNIKQETDPVKHIIRFAPLKSVGLALRSLEFGYQYNVNPGLALQATGACLLPYSVFTSMEGSRGPMHGYKASLAVKKIWNTPRGHRPYAAFEVGLMQMHRDIERSYATGDSIMNIRVSYMIPYSRTNISFNLIHGIEIYVSKHLDIEAYVGLGLKHRYGKIEYTTKPPYAERPTDFFPSIDFYRDLNDWTISIPCNIRIGYKFL